jgi:hypothetical protein
MNGYGILDTLGEILLTKVSYDTDIPESELRSEPRFWNYWTEYLVTADDDWTLTDVIEYALELAYNGAFSDDLWERN